MEEKRRMNDPEAWRSLDDDQREAINSWYQEEIERFSKKEEAEGKRIRNLGFYGLVPIAAYLSLKFTKYVLSFSTVGIFLLSFFLCGAVYLIGCELCERLIGKEDPTWSRILIFAADVLISFIVILTVHGWIS